MKKKTEIRVHLYTQADVSICLDLFEINENNEFEHLNDSGTYSPYKMGVFIQ